MPRSFNAQCPSKSSRLKTFSDVWNCAGVVSSDHTEANWIGSGSSHSAAAKGALLALMPQNDQPI